MKTVKHLFQALAVTTMVAAALTSWSFTPSQQPPESTAVPGNVLLALSVEWPTGLQSSYPAQDYTVLTDYEGYFDARKCYHYNQVAEVFEPAGATTAGRGCTNANWWSGNLLNWLTMTNLDQFRSVLTGGTRDTVSSVQTTPSGDSTTSTVLIRSFADRFPGASITPRKRLTAGTPGMPLTTNRFVRTAGYGTKIIVSTDDSFPNVPGLAGQLQSCADYGGTGSLHASDTCMNVRVRVCESIGGVGIEPNCRARYVNPVNGAVIAKPEGLIQEYAQSLRFGAVAYLNDRPNTRDGAVIRAAMKSVGPVAATASGLANNPALEWDVTTGVMFKNPNSADATASGVFDSGLMNYLNKFGYTRGYIGIDPVSELFYAAQLYLRGRPLPAAFTNNLTASQIDGFPVITGSTHQRGGARDPIINTCQKNFILAIGDIFTHCDGNLPGSNKTGCSAAIPTDPDGLNVQSLWNTTRAMEGNMPDARHNTGQNGWAGGAGGDINYTTPYVAGLAHWANTNDIRSDLAGTQTISTYFVDVLENNNGVVGILNASRLRTQFWLAAKYGGFDITVASSTNPNVSSTSWDKDGNGVPDTWFAGSSPSLLKSGLSNAFADIAARSSANSASSAAVTSSRQTSNSQIIYAGYNPKDWSGTVRACSTTQNAQQCNDRPVWEASNWFNPNVTTTYVTSVLTASSRTVVTSWLNTSTFAFNKMPFQWSSLNASQQAILQSNDNQGSARLAYLRGDRSQEGSVFRARPAGLLGDIVNSGVTYVSGASPALRFTGHATYRTATKNRVPVVYVGGNDGMLHAFSGSDGKELFAYVPSAVFSNLPGLTALNFQHRYFVDSTPMYGDIETGSGWATILVGGLGAGGRGFYALDITNQNAFAASSESALSALPMWEFTSAQDSDLGYTFNEPSINSVTGAYQQIAKVADSTTAGGAWRVLVGNGYGSSAGNAVLFMLNANTGTAATKLLAQAGPNNGLSAPTPVDTDRDNLIDTIYAGDLQGNVHKFQFSKLAGTDYVLAKSGDASGAWRYIGRLFAGGEPITTAPSVAPACDGIGWNVAFGSGKLNEDVDYSDTTSRRGFYAVVDKAPSSTITVSTNDLATITYSPTTLGSGAVGRTWASPNLTGKKGWKMFFTGGERVLTNSTMPPDTGTVLFGTTKPSGDVCEPGNSGFIMAVNLCTAGIGNLVVNGTTVGGIAIDSSGVVKVSNTYTDEKGKPTVVCNQDDCKDAPPKLTPSMAPRGRYNWREILLK